MKNEGAGRVCLSAADWWLLWDLTEQMLRLTQARSPGTAAEVRRVLDCQRAILRPHRPECGPWRPPA